jgi:hypothetical protein
MQISHLTLIYVAKPAFYHAHLVSGWISFAKCAITIMLCK